MSQERQKLIEQVLEYWYTVDFLAQGGLNTEETRRDRENRSFAMSFPHRFSMLYRHEDLGLEESILAKIEGLEGTVREKRRELLGEPADMMKPPCHGKITVYMGSVDQSWLSRALAQELECDPPLNPGTAKLALASMQLTDEGKYIKGTLSLSPVVWALGRILGRDEQDSMYDILDPDAYASAPEDLEPDADQVVSHYQDLYELTKKIIDRTVRPLDADPAEAGLGDGIHFNYTVYRDAGEKEKRETDDYFGLSMSFYATDLAKFRKAAAQNKWYSNDMWETLADYICAPYDMEKGAGRDRIDLGNDALKDPVRSQIARCYLKKILDVDQSPLGKWPSRYQPFLMQQVAINRAINTDFPMTAVNGPPGTGKTTLLKEIVADNVVRKALILAEYEKPDQMFVSNELQAGHSRRYIYSFRPDMKDIKRYGIVVASSNNNAVENISKQLPLEEPMRKGLGITTASSCLSEVQQMFSMDYAPVESAERINFEKEGRPKERVDFPDIYFSSYAGKLLRDSCWGLISAPLGKRSNVYAFYKNVLSQLKWDRYLQNASGSRMDSYRKAREEFLEQYDMVVRCRKILKARADDAEARGLEEYGEGDDRILCLSERLLDNLASDDPEVRKKAQMSCVRLSRRYDEEREKLFGYALRLTKEFILSSAACKQNLELLSMAWGMETYQNVFTGMNVSERKMKLRECMTPLIQTLQLLVPVISTTFASAGRFFEHVNRAEALGMIVVDEAGQATPQMALSLFSKASRAIVVGDPNQIDPVVSDELAFLETTLDDEIGSAYSDRTISVQKIADWLSPYGSEQSDILGRFGKKWVGLPLYVHSRCIEPMFSISNRLSYGDTMLRITGTPDPGKQFCYNVSQWINITGEAESEKNHFVRVQGERVLELLENAFAAAAASDDEGLRTSGPDIFVISPFHTVAEGMRQLMANSFNEKHPILLQNREMAENWLTDDQNPHIGTVHTFQGREADEVILLLGCDEKSKRSANWVNRNIVNVAVSRAKYRLYAVGDVKVWQDCGSVMEMKFDLDTSQLERIANADAPALAPAETDEDLFNVPDLPTSEMFDISDITEETGEEEYRIDTDSGIDNVRAAVPGIAGDFTVEHLGWFGLSSMEEFESLFDDRIKDHLRTGMWIYTWLKPNAGSLPVDYDVSFAGICFSKAYEKMLKQNYYIWLQQLFPDEIVQGKRTGLVSPEQVMIGDITTFISDRLAELARLMKDAGHAECDISWWSGLIKRFRICKDYRNKCAHPGEVFRWDELEKLISLLLTGCNENGVHASGLMMNNVFRDTAADILGVPVQNEVTSSVQTDAVAEYQGSLFRYCPVYCKMHICSVDGNSLVQEIFLVKNKDGKDKKLNMLHCRKCGRKFLNISTLSATINLGDYYLEAVRAEDW